MCSQAQYNSLKTAIFAVSNQSISEPVESKKGTRKESDRHSETP